MDVHNSLMDDFNAGTLKYSALKDAVADALVGVSTPIKEKKEALIADKKAVKNRIKASSAEIRKRAQETIKEVKDLTGLVNVRF